MKTDVLQKMNVEFFISEERTHEGIVIPKLCHGTRIVKVETGEENIEDCDGVITENTELQLGITTADCAPVCFSDGTRIGVIHAGWRGLCSGIIEKALTEFDTDNLEVYVGPHLHTFEVQRDFCYEAIVIKFGEQFFIYEDGKIIFRFKDAVASCLPEHAIFDERSTYIDTSLPSYRRDKTKTRLVTVVSRVIH